MTSMVNEGHNLINGLNYKFLYFQAVKTGVCQNGTGRNSMYGSMYGLSTGKSTFTEIATESAQNASEVLAMVIVC